MKTEEEPEEGRAGSRGEVRGSTVLEEKAWDRWGRGTAGPAAGSVRGCESQTQPPLLSTQRGEGIREDRNAWRQQGYRVLNKTGNSVQLSLFTRLNKIARFEVTPQRGVTGGGQGIWVPLHPLRFAGKPVCICEDTQEKGEQAVETKPATRAAQP